MLPPDPEDEGLTVEEFRNLTTTFVDSMKQSSFHVDTDRIFALLLDAYVANRTDPKQLRAAHFQVWANMYLSSWMHCFVSVLT